MTDELKAIKRAVSAAKRKGWKIVLDGASGYGTIRALTKSEFNEGLENGVSLNAYGEEVCDADESCGMGGISCDAIYIPMSGPQPTKRQTLMDKIMELERTIEQLRTPLTPPTD